LKKTWEIVKHPAGYVLVPGGVPPNDFPNSTAASLHEDSSTTTRSSGQFSPFSVIQ